MSKRSEPVAADECIALGATDRQLQSYPTRTLNLGSIPITRALPVKDKRLVGPWCFLDRFGPLTFSEGMPMDVATHPHMGLQTVTWLLDGEVLHNDSLGYESLLRPNGVNVMTSGSGIAHAEQTPRDNTGRLQGAQLWVALPEQDRHMDAGFAHVSEVPTVESQAGLARVFAGSLHSATSPAPHYSDLVAADLQVHPRHTLNMPLDPSFEHAVLVLSGDCMLDGVRLDEPFLYYLGSRRSDASFSSHGGSRVLLLGGPPFPETILMWWNFVARTPEEMAQARADWEEQRRFGDVPAYRGDRLSAPSLSRLARPNPVS